ncbi:MAG: thioesterase family protein [Actinomycetota bacterium]|nr:thioesterase family protein [Actinomycetota bacterium]
MSGAPHNIRTDTTLTPDPEIPGRLHADIPPAWNVMHIFGGVSMYTALRAMQETLDRPDMPLVTANAIFLAPVTAGPVTVDVDVLRGGRRASQVAADLRVAGTEGVALRAHGVFGQAHDVDHHYQEVRFPEAPLPEQTPLPPDPDRPNPFGEISFHQQTAWRPVSPLDDPGRGQFLSWVRLLEGEPDLLTLAVHGDVLGPAVGRALGPSLYGRMVLSLEIGIRFIAVPVTPWVLQEIEAWHVGDGYATGPARLWDEDRNLCAIATQTAHLRVMKPQ